MLLERINKATSFSNDFFMYELPDHHLYLEQALDVLMKVAFQISVPRGPSPLDGSTKIQSSSSNIYQS